jgi:hypothetical protein
LDSVSKKRILTLDDIILEEALAAGASLASKNQRSFDQIKEALQASIDAEKKIPQELERLRAIPIETGLDAVIVGYYTDLIQWQVKQAATAARVRMQHFDHLAITGKYKAELERAASDTLYWFKYYAFTNDPRPDSPVQDFPFIPFEYQREFIIWLERQVFLYRKGGVIEKSRDMGASWMVVCWNVKQWLFTPGYTALLGSRKEDYVDKRGDMGSLFEKIRYQVRFLPEYMLPKGFDPTAKDAMPFMKLVNPANKAVLVGESSNPDYGRGGRFTATFEDEFAFFPSGGDEAFSALSQSSRSNFFISTPNGKNNRFYLLRFSNNYPVFTIHWRLHPWKDDRWYEIESSKMTVSERAQEIDLDYEASLSGRIFSEWDEKYHVITWGEFAKFFGASAIGNDKKPRIPRHWYLGRGMDWGTTLDHPTAVIWVARPGAGEPLSDCVFVYRELVRPLPGKEEPITPLRIGKQIFYLQAPYSEESRFTMSIMSHEATSEMNALQLDMPTGMRLSFSKWEPNMTDGIGVLQNYLQIDPRRKHPFRPFLEKGSPRIFFIASDDQGELIPNDFGGYHVKPATDDGGLARLRAEIPAYHYPKNASGEERNKPYPFFNDAIDALRKLAANWFPPVAEKSGLELLEEKLPQNLKTSAFKEIVDPDEMAMRWLSRQVYMKQNDLDYSDSPGKHWRDRLYEETKIY